MSMTTVEIGRIKRELTEQIGSVTRNHSLSVAQKSAQLDSIERKMAGVREQESNSRRFSALQHMGSTPGNENFSDDHHARPARSAARFCRSARTRCASCTSAS